MSIPTATGTSASGGEIATAASAGGVVATVVIALVNLLPNDTGAKPVLLALTPWISVGISSTVLWMRGEMRRRRDTKRLTEVLNETRKALQALIDDPNTPSDKRSQYRADLAKLSELIIETNMEETQAILKRRQQ